jgi:hypothetical protein
MELFKEALKWAESDDPTLKLEAAQMFKFLYQQAEKIQKWEWVEDKDRADMQKIMDDLKERIEAL